MVYKPVDQSTALFSMIKLRNCGEYTDRLPTHSDFRYPPLLFRETHSRLPNYINAFFISLESVNTVSKKKKSLHTEVLSKNTFKAVLYLMEIRIIPRITPKNEN